MVLARGIRAPPGTCCSFFFFYVNLIFFKPHVLFTKLVDCLMTELEDIYLSHNVLNTFVANIMLNR